MKIKIIAAVGILVVICLGVWFAITAETSQKDNPAAPLPATTISMNTGTTTPSIPETKEVIYTNNGFDPAVTRIRPGDSVTFKNQSSKTLQLISGTFTGASIAKGKQFTTTFGEVGTLAISDKMHPDKIGVILVQ